MFKNYQWAVDEYGLAAHPDDSMRSYHIGAERLLERRTEGDGTLGLYMWPVHLAEKRWTDLNAFSQAFEAALLAHEPVCGQVDRALLEASYREAEKIKGAVQ